jgi:hypothetical protein
MSDAPEPPPLPPEWSEPERAGPPAPDGRPGTRLHWAPLHGLLYGVGVFLAGFVTGIWAMLHFPLVGILMLVGSALALAGLPGMTQAGDCPHCGHAVLVPWNRRCPHCKHKLAVESGDRLVDKGA